MAGWPGDLVAVQGVGGLGHLAIQYAARLGFRVVAIARSENEENLAFSLANDVRPVVETVPLEQAADAYARMMSGAARFRMVLTTKS